MSDLQSAKQAFQKAMRLTGRHWKVIVPSLFLGGALITDGGLIYNYAAPNQFTLKTNWSAVSDETTGSGLHLHLWPATYTHDYPAQIQRINFNAGGIWHLPFGDSTADQNHLHARMRLNYTVSQDTDSLQYHRWGMEDYFGLPAGYFMLTGYMNSSANAIMGQDEMGVTLGNPEAYLEAFSRDFSFRLQQNNVPIQIESIELEGFGTFFPTRDVSYNRINVSGSEVANEPVLRR